MVARPSSRRVNPNGYFTRIIYRVHCALEGECGVPSQEEQVELLNTIKNGKTCKVRDAALTEFMARNMPLVASIASKYHTTYLEPDDLLMEGTIGLMKAIEKFDLSRGITFSTYATWWIRSFMSRAVAEQEHMIRRPSKFNQRVRRLNEKISHKRNLVGGKVTEAELAVMAGVPISEYDEVALISSMSETVSFDCLSVKEIERQSSIAREADQFEDALFNSNREFLEAVLCVAEAEHGKRNVDIVRARFGLGQEPPMTLSLLGEKFNLTRERARQIVVEVLRAMRYIAIDLKSKSGYSGG